MCAYFRICTRYNSICFRTRDRPSSHATKKGILDFLACAEEVLEWRPTTVHTTSSTTTTSVVLPTCFSQAALQSRRTCIYKIQVRRYLRLTSKITALSSCFQRASMIIKHCIIQLMHNIKYEDKIKIIKYLEVLQYV